MFCWCYQCVCDTADESRFSVSKCKLINAAVAAAAIFLFCLLSSGAPFHLPVVIHMRWIMNVVGRERPIQFVLLKTAEIFVRDNSAAGSGKVSLVPLCCIIIAWMSVFLLIYWPNRLEFSFQFFLTETLIDVTQRWKFFLKAKMTHYDWNLKIYTLENLVFEIPSKTLIAVGCVCCVFIGQIMYPLLWVT